jgi:hypothetical protein
VALGAADVAGMRAGCSQLASQCVTRVSAGCRGCVDLWLSPARTPPAKTLSPLQANGHPSRQGHSMRVDRKLPLESASSAQLECAPPLPSSTAPVTWHAVELMEAQVREVGLVVLGRMRAHGQVALFLLLVVVAPIARRRLASGVPLPPPPALQPHPHPPRRHPSLSKAHASAGRQPAALPLTREANGTVRTSSAWRRTTSLPVLGSCCDAVDTARLCRRPRCVTPSLSGVSTVAACSSAPAAVGAAAAVL